MPSDAIRVAVLVRDGVSQASLGVTLDVLSAANRIATTAKLPARSRFTFEVLGVRGRSVATATGHKLQVDATIAGRESRRGDIVVLPGVSLPTPAELLRGIAQRDCRIAVEWLGRQWRSGATIAASCSSTFLVAEAGLLDGRTATTSWFLAPLFRARYPRVKLRSDLVVTREKRLFCAGAALAQGDLALAIVADRLGPRVADLCRRYLLLDERASQSPYLHLPQLAAQDETLSKAEQWVRRHLSRPFAIPELARQLGLGARTLARRIERTTGAGPVAFVQRIRADAALELLQTTALSLEEIGGRVGYRDPGALRRVLKRETGRGIRELRATAARAA